MPKGRAGPRRGTDVSGTLDRGYIDVIRSANAQPRPVAGTDGTGKGAIIGRSGKGGKGNYSRIAVNLNAASRISENELCKIERANGGYNVASN